MLADKYPEIKDYTLIYHLYPINDETFAAVGDKGIYYYNTKRDSLYIPGTDNPDFEQNIKYFGILKDTRDLNGLLPKMESEFGTKLSYISSPSLKGYLIMKYTPYLKMTME